MDRTRIATGLRAAVATLGLSLAGCKGALPPCACVDPQSKGCASPDFLLVESLSGVSVGTGRPPELSATPAYDAVRDRITSVAIRLPDSCNQEGAAQVSGQSRSAEMIVRTQCGVWLSELEKALVAERFRVVSWDALRGLERSKNIPAYAAAAELGADIVLIFNSLDASNVLADREVAARHRYFKSNEKGDAIAPAVLAETERAPLRAYAVDKIRALQQDQVVAAKLAQMRGVASVSPLVVALSSTLDVTAVLARDFASVAPATPAAPVSPEAAPPAPPAPPARSAVGEAVWFYRLTTMKGLRDAVGWRFLFQKHEARWYPTAPPRQPAVAEAPRESYSAEDSVAGAEAAGTDPYATERLDLVRSVARDFVERFRGKAGG